MVSVLFIALVDVAGGRLCRGRKSTTRCRRSGLPILSSLRSSLTRGQAGASRRRCVTSSMCNVDSLDGGEAGSGGNKTPLGLGTYAMYDSDYSDTSEGDATSWYPLLCVCLCCACVCVCLCCACLCVCLFVCVSVLCMFVCARNYPWIKSLNLY